MKPNDMPDRDNSIETVMKRWVVQTPLPPRFQEQVWQRIARAESHPEPGLRAALGRWLDSVLPRPKAALIYMAALLVSGMAAGSVTAQIQSSRVEADLSARYVQSINPYQGEVLHP